MTSVTRPSQRLEKHLAKNPDNSPVLSSWPTCTPAKNATTKPKMCWPRRLEASGGDVGIRERLEDAQFRTSRAQLDIAKKKAEKERTPEAISLYKKMKKELNARELEYYRSRSERYPTKLNHKFELAMRLKKPGEYPGSHQELPGRRRRPQDKAKVHLELGECFQTSSSTSWPCRHYESPPWTTSTAREVDDRKTGPLPGRQARPGPGRKAPGRRTDRQGKEELDRAEKHLNELAGLEFGYEDVPQLLDKIAKIRHKG